MNRKSYKGESNPFWGRKHSEETRAKISLACRGRVSPTKGKKMPEEHKEKLRQLSIGRTPWNKGRKLNEKEYTILALAREKALSKIRGRRMSEEQKLKISKSNAGKSHGVKGENNHLWKGGITPIALQIRHSMKYRQFWRSVCERDSWTCVLCKAIKTNLNVDHYPIMFSSLLREVKAAYGNDNLYENALNYNKLWDLNNARTLCVLCHKQTPTYLNGAFVIKN